MVTVIDQRHSVLSIQVYIYNMYTYSVVTTSHGIYNFPGSGSYTAAGQGSYTMGGYKVLVYIVQSTYTIALSWFI